MKRLAAFVLLVSFRSGLADDAAWTYVGSAGNFTHNGQIRMVSERVGIRLAAKNSHFHALFVFRNEGPPATVTMAFPEKNHNYPARRAIFGFRSTVDGRRVRVTRMRLPRSQSEHDSEYVAVWLKKVSFASHQTRRVVVDYWARNGDIGDHVETSYILKTGATWKGNIDDCRIDVDWSGFRGNSDPWFATKSQDKYRSLGRTRQRHRTMRFSNFKPDFDLVMSWWNDGSNFELNGKLTAADGFGENGNNYVYGSPSDPRIEAKYIPFAFAREVDESAPDPSIGHPFSVAGHQLRVLGCQTIEVDGRRRRLRRSGGLEGREKCVYLRDLVLALGGTIRYSRKLDRIIMRIMG